MCIAEGT